MIIRECDNYLIYVGVSLAGDLNATHRAARVVRDQEAASYTSMHVRDVAPLFPAEGLPPPIHTGNCRDS